MKNLNYIFCLLTAFYSFNSFASLAIDELGERLFLEPRFSKDAQISCGTCHQVDQQFSQIGMRGYNDNNLKTPIQFRAHDQKSETLRNTPTLVEIASSFYPTRFVHYDGEVTIAETVLGNMAGRNMGWLSTEEQNAKNNILSVLRTDDGSGDLAKEFGGSYEKVFQGFQINVHTANENDLIEFITKAVVAYIEGIEFEKDDQGNFVGSPYDQFLLENNLPNSPSQNETITEYTIRLRNALAILKNPKWIKPKVFSNHQDRSFEFNQEHLNGLKLFMNLPTQSGGRGMCLNCHMPPMFSDGLFHNIGLVQTEYEQIHGQGSFNQLAIPSFHQKKSLKDNPFLIAANAHNPMNVDLGAWNVYGRIDKPEQTKFFNDLFCMSSQCTEDEVLGHLVGRMKTPTLRNLGHSDPYFHSGSADTILTAVSHYKTTSEASKINSFRNLDHRVKMMQLSDQDVLAITSFLESLNENYE